MHIFYKWKSTPAHFHRAINQVVFTYVEQWSVTTEAKECVCKIYVLFACVTLKVLDTLNCFGQFIWIDDLAPHVWYIYNRTLTFTLNKCKALSTDCNVIWVDTNHHLHSHFWLRKLSKNRCYIHVAVRLPHPFIQGIVQSLNFTHISLWTDLCSQSAPESTELITSYGSYLKGTLVE